MPAFLIPILGKIIPYFLGAIAIIGAYFGFKHKVAKEEREKLKAEQAKVIEEVHRKVEAAVEKDRKIDEDTRGKVNADRPAQVPTSTEDDLKPGDIFKF